MTKRINVLGFVFVCVAVVFLIVEFTGIALNNDVLISIGVLGSLFSWLIYHFFCDVLVYLKKENLDDKK